MSETVERTELLIPGPAEALANLLEVDCPDFNAGDGLPLFWHWIYLLERPHQSALGNDGHPVAGFPAPPGPGRRRMWAGGRIQSIGALRIGAEATRRTSVVSTREKEGRSGSLTFVTVRHEILQNGTLVVDEHQDIVYIDGGATPGDRSAGASDTEATGAHPVAENEWSINVNPVLLFRFSALTYNGHRIHYDRDYARNIEGYPGLVTHGPLQVMVMSEAVRKRSALPPVGISCYYRLVAPLFDHQGLIANTRFTTDGIAAFVRDSWGRETATATFSRRG